MRWGLDINNERSSPDEPLLSDKERQLLLAKARKIASQIQEYNETHRLHNFVPFGAQREFFEKADRPRRAVFAGNRYGKSTTGVVEDCSWLLGERLFYEPSSRLRRLGIPEQGVKGLVIAEDWDKVKEIFTEKGDYTRPGKFFFYLPEKHIEGVTKRQNGIIDSIKVSNVIDGQKRSSIVYFDTVQSYKLNPKGQESSDWDFIHVDEPIPQGLWTAISRGLIDRGGSSWWLLTPLAFPWMYEEAVDGAVRDPGYWWWQQASIHDNPTLSEREKEEYLRSLPEDERQARERGKPLAHGRLVYSNFTKSRHVWEHSTPSGWTIDNDLGIAIPPRDYYCYYSIDPHSQTPHAVLFTAIAPTGQVFFFHEIFAKSTISELAREIKKVASKVRVGVALCDPIAWIEDPETGLRWADHLHAAGLPVQEASKNKTVGILLTNDLFGSDRPVFVMPHLHNFLREIRRYVYNRENKPIDKDDHLMECMYRTVIHDNLQYRSPISPLPSRTLTTESFDAVDYTITLHPSEL